MLLCMPTSLLISGEQLYVLCNHWENQPLLAHNILPGSKLSWPPRGVGLVMACGEALRDHVYKAKVSIVSSKLTELADKE